jgi:hypothetical protein
MAVPVDAGAHMLAGVSDPPRTLDAVKAAPLAAKNNLIVDKIVLG